MRFLKGTAVVTLLVMTAASARAAHSISLWIPPWSTAALSSIQTNLGSFQESNPVWYSLNADGSIARNWNAENPTWRAAMTGSRVVPTIQNVVSGRFSASTVSALLANPAMREAHATAIAQLVDANAFDGIDIDYEALPFSARGDFTAFITFLAQRLHASGKKLSVTVSAKTSDAQNWSGPGAEDWIALGVVADELKIMAYDYSWSTSAAGPIAPLDWIDRVARYAESVIPAKKIVIGLPFFGYDWLGSSGSGVTYASATKTALDSGAAINHDANGEATYTYAGRTVFFQDATSYAAKVRMLEEKHGAIAGFAHWAAGQEDPAVWNVIRGGATTSTPPPPTGGSPAQPAGSDFAISGPSLLEVQQGSSATADYRISPINGFSANAAVEVQAVSAGFTGRIVPSASALAPAGVLTLAIAPTAETPAGVYQVSLRLTSGSLSHEQLISVSVKAAPAAGRRRAVR